MVYGSMAVRRSLVRAWRRFRRPTLARLVWASIALHVVVALGVFGFAVSYDVLVGRNVVVVVRVFVGLLTVVLCRCYWMLGVETLSAKLKKVG